MYKSFEEMPVWKMAFQLANDIYDLIEKFPKLEIYALSDQLRRSSLSISANIAESYGRYHILDKINFYYHSRGSLCETKSHLRFALERKYISIDEYSRLSSTIEKIYNEINALINSLRRNHTNK